MREGQLFYVTGSGPFAPVAVLGLTRLFGVSEAGEVSENSIPFDLERFGLTSVRTGYSDRLVTFETGSAALKLGAGAGCLFGKPASGKSLFADTMQARNDNVKVIRFREPDPDSLMYERSLVQALWVALNSGSVEAVIVDSLRTTFYMSGGATGKGGVNMGIFPLLTAYDILAKHMGKIVMFALNPMTTDDDAIQFYLEAAKGSVAHTLHATQPKHLTVSSRSFLNRDDYRQRYEPVAKTGSVIVPTERPPVLVRRAEDSIVDLYVTPL